MKLLLLTVALLGLAVGAAAARREMKPEKTDQRPGEMVRWPISPFLALPLSLCQPCARKVARPFGEGYARLSLSREGQAIIAAQKGGEKGYAPLSAQEVVAELAKLE
jgi:hypothetical protein